MNDAYRLIRDDAARWVRPEQIADPHEVTLPVIARLLFRHLPFRATTWFRLATAAQQAGVRGVSGWVQRRLLRVYGLELAPGVPFGGGLYIAHPVGCVLMAESVGRNLTVIGSATFGTRGDHRWPVIGDDVFVGIGARILGGITVGDGASIGANAVVVKAVAPGDTVVGIPARSTRIAPTPNR
jgi:serine O-acetyltransferase